MRTLLNIIWLPLSGLWLAIGYAIAGIVMFILILTIPIALWPFGREVVPADDVSGALSDRRPADL